MLKLKNANKHILHAERPNNLKKVEKSLKNY